MYANIWDKLMAYILNFEIHKTKKAKFNNIYQLNKIKIKIKIKSNNKIRLWIIQNYIK